MWHTVFLANYMSSSYGLDPRYLFFSVVHFKKSEITLKTKKKR